MRTEVDSRRVRELCATWEFEVAIMDRCATRIEPFEWGTAVFQDEMPRVYDQNLLRVERGFDALTARSLASEADRLQRAAGLSHRKVIVPDEEAGERLGAEFAELSWQRGRNVLMAYRGDAPAPPRQRVSELDAQDLREARVRASKTDLGGGPAEQIAHSLELIASVVELSHAFAVVVGGEPVSWCALYSENGIGQIDDVVTVTQHRRRGYGRAVVESAVRASLELGNHLTFLVADDNDWPKEMYARIGFEPLGRRHEFTRT